jgi:hypothetical protein
VNEVEKLKAALRQAMEWNWLDYQDLPPQEVIEQIFEALGEPVPPEMRPGS